MFNKKGKGTPVAQGGPLLPNRHFLELTTIKEANQHTMLPTPQVSEPIHIRWHWKLLRGQEGQGWMHNHHPAYARDHPKIWPMLFPSHIWVCILTEKDPDNSLDLGPSEAWFPKTKSLKIKDRESGKRSYAAGGTTASPTLSTFGSHPGETSSFIPVTALRQIGGTTLFLPYQRPGRREKSTTNVFSILIFTNAIVSHSASLCEQRWTAYKFNKQIRP